MENVPLYAARGAVAVPRLDCGVYALYARGAYRGAYGRVYAACKDEGAYARAGDLPPRIAKRYGCNISVYTVGVYKRFVGLAYN